MSGCFCVYTMRGEDPIFLSILVMCVFFFRGSVRVEGFDGGRRRRFIRLGNW